VLGGSNRTKVALNAVVQLRTSLVACALAEAVAFGGDATLRWPARMALDRLEGERAPGGGWRGWGWIEWLEQTSATAWALWAWGAAEAAGIEMPTASRDGADAWLEGASSDPAGLQEDPADEARPHGEPVGARARHRTHVNNDPLSDVQRAGRAEFHGVPMADLGVVCRHLLGWPRSHPTLVGGGNVLLEHLPVWMGWDGDDPPVPWLYSYWMWGSLAAHVLGGRVERAWFDRLGPVLVDHQRTFPDDVAGSWEFDERRWSDRSDTYATAAAVLALESGYRLAAR
jgi:hypothetical protein